VTLSLRLQSQIIVADARPHDYQELSLLAVQHGWQVHLLTSARAVLRLTHFMPADLYLVNALLPDMSGFDLFEMLRDRIPTARVFIVSDSYNDEDERLACRCGADLYVCKGSNHSVDFSALLDFVSGQQGSRQVAGPVTAPLANVDSLQSSRVRSTSDVPLGGSTH